MGIRERRERERQELREQILTAAQELAAQSSWQAVTIRKVAERVEYSPPMIYEHFASKEAILIELMRLGNARMRDALRAAHDGAKGPRAAVREMALAYCRFAWRYPELYQVMYGLGGVPFCAEPLPDEVKEVFFVAYKAIEALQTQAGARVGDLETAVEVLWAALHGIITLGMTDRIEGGPEHVEALALTIVNTLFAAWQATGGD
jgi:AcrR family transcriptional regulator